MSDIRELLEMAAKAAGHQISQVSDEIWSDDHAEYVQWAPQADDGDALRLAVMIPGLNLQWIIAEAWQAHNDQASRMNYVRFAILRAAAAIGSAMA